MRDSPWAASTSSCSVPGSTATAAASSLTWGSDSFPSLRASAFLGASPQALPVSKVDWACPTPTPSVSAINEAALRWPDSRQMLEDSIRVARESLAAVANRRTSTTEA